MADSVNLEVQDSGARVGGDSHNDETLAICLNCKSAFSGDHCNCCGQKANLHRSMSAFWHDIVHSLFHFEGKIWRTLPLLFFSPGELTRRYVHGERTRFISPIALFLFTVFLMFALLGNLQGLNNFSTSAHTNARRDTLAQVEQSLVTLRADIAHLKAERAALVQRRLPTREVDQKLADALAQERQGSAARALLTDEKSGKSTANQTVGMSGYGSSFELEAQTGWATLDNAVKRAVENPELWRYKLKSSIYKFSWALIPLSLPFMWLLFFRRRNVFMYDHAVFVTYSLCFMSIWAVILAELAGLGWLPAPLLVLLLLVPVVHLYRQLKGAYALTRNGALIRLPVLLASIGIIVPVFLIAMLLIGVLN